MVIGDTSTTLTLRGDRQIAEQVSAGGSPIPPSAMFYAPPGEVGIYAIKGGCARMSAHLFPAHLRRRNERDIPESFLTVAGAVLAALVILIALAVVTGASGAGACN
jgi:hypothetical protein